MKPDWVGKRMPPSFVAGLLGDSPKVRTYASRRGRNLARSFEDYLKSVLKPLSRWEQVRDFLAGCLYSKDVVEHGGRRDVWLHPEDFEERLRGDCEDHALWAWVQLARMNWDVRFTVGILDGTGHAWVTSYRRTSIQVIETTEKSRDKLLIPALGSAYEPVWSVDSQLRFWTHA